jgi:asparagine synthase (glutamine-hydrolysing)
LNERPYIEAVLDRGTFNPRFLALDGYAPFDGLEAMIAHNGRLSSAPGLIQTHRLYEQLAAEGFRVFLDGHGGDEVISHGLGRINELAIEGKWRKVWQELGGAAKTFNDGRIGQFIFLFLQHAKYKGVYRIRKLASDFTKRLASKDLSILGPKLKAFSGGPLPWLPDTEAERVQAYLRSRHMTYAIELLEQVAAGVGTQPRFPFFDKRMVEFCLALPGEARLDNGRRLASQGTMALIQV